MVMGTIVQNRIFRSYFMCMRRFVDIVWMFVFPLMYLMNAH